MIECIFTSCYEKHTLQINVKFLSSLVAYPEYTGSLLPHVHLDYKIFVVLNAWTCVARISIEILYGMK